jgi:K+-transporting ATPase ATPase C chain
MYGGGPKKGQPVAADIESWFRQDRFGGKPGIVAQWAGMHSGVAGNWLHDWVKADKLCADYLADWEKAHPEEVAGWKRDNPDNPEPKPEDLAAGLAVPFFASFSKDHPGTFPGIVELKTQKKVAPVREGSDIQSLFFDLWLQDHPGAELEQVPADMVTTSGSGLDPHVTLQNARWQLSHRVAAAWAKKTGRSPEKLREEIDRLLVEKSFSPLGGLVGVPLLNVLEVNLALGERYQKTGDK